MFALVRNLGTRLAAKSDNDTITPRARSAIGRAEEVLLRGNEIRGQIQARCEGEVVCCLTCAMKHCQRKKRFL